jgi:hypothetical protein
MKIPVPKGFFPDLVNEGMVPEYCGWKPAWPWWQKAWVFVKTRESKKVYFFKVGIFK